MTMKVIQRGDHTVCHFFMLWRYWGECLLIPGQIIHLTGSPHRCPGAAQVSKCCLTCWLGIVFPETTSTPYFLARTGDRHTKRSFFFSSGGKPWGDVLFVSGSQWPSGWFSNGGLRVVQRGLREDKGPLAWPVGETNEVSPISGLLFFK